MRLSEILSEDVGGNYLYHSVRNLDTALKILKSGIIDAQSNPEDVLDYGLPNVDVVSLSRDQYNRFPYGKGKYQFVIDKDVLKKKGIKVVPFSYGSDVMMVQFRAESEERAQKFIPVGPPYVVELQVLEEENITPTLQKLCNTVGIPIKLMKRKGIRKLSPLELKRKQERDNEIKLDKQDFDKRGDPPFAYGLGRNCVVGFGNTKIKVNSEEKKNRMYDILSDLWENGTKLTKEIMIEILGKLNKEDI